MGRAVAVVVLTPEPLQGRSKVVVVVASGGMLCRAKEGDTDRGVDGGDGEFVGSVMTISGLGYKRRNTGPRRSVL